MGQVIRQRRSDLGMSQAQLATAVGVDTRQIRRYEANQQQPVLGVAVAIANALGITIGDLAGTPGQRIDLTGDWWSSWQTFKDGQEVITAQDVRIHQHGDVMDVRALTRGIDAVDGGYLWRGELRLWDNEILMGWYVAEDAAVRSKGTMYFVLHPHGINMTGRWVGLSYDGAIVTGWGTMARSEDDARALIDQLKQPAPNVPAP